VIHELGLIVCLTLLVFALGGSAGVISVAFPMARLLVDTVECGTMEHKLRYDAYLYK